MAAPQLLLAVGYPDFTGAWLLCRAFFILPVHNQAGEFPGLVADSFRQCSDGCHVIVVDDHSCDGTLLMAHALKKIYAPRLHIARQSS